MAAKRRGARGKRHKNTHQDQHWLEQIHRNAAGIDIGAEVHWVAVPEGRDEQTVQSFPSFTADLHRLADWLEACGVDTVAMESTGIYWVPLYEILEERGIEVLLVNARHVKNVPGRKTDVLDCQWLQQLHTFGLLRGSFRPDAEITSLRTLLRHRQVLVTSAASFIQRMQKALGLMNLKLQHVISDITGKTGLAIVRAIAAGESDPERLARHRHPKIRASHEEIVESLRGHYQPEHIFELRQNLALYEFHLAQIEECDARIEAVLAKLEPASGDTKPEPPSKTRTRGRGRHEPNFPIRSPLFRMTGGVDLTDLPGVAEQAALTLVSEVGLDMKRWPTEKHFTSWLTLAPANRISGGKLLSSRTTPSANRAARVFRMSAMSVSRSQTALGAAHRSLAARIGQAKAIVATARKIAVLFYRMLRHKIPCRALTTDDYDVQQRARVLRSLRKRAKSLGLQLLDPVTGEVAGAAVS